LVEKPEGKRPLGKAIHRREDNINMGLQEMRWGHGLDCSGSKQGKWRSPVNAVINLRFPQNAENFFTS
jgi:hypothetical protein